MEAVALPSNTDILLENEQRRLTEARQNVEQIDPSRSLTEVFLDNMGSINLIFANFLLERIVESQPSGRTTPQMLVLLVLILVVWGIANWTIKQWVVWMAVSNRVFATGIALFLSDITGILTFLTIQYALSIFTAQSREGALTLTESIVIALVIKLVLSASTAIVQKKNDLDRLYHKHTE